MRRPTLLEAEFIIIAALTLPPMLWGIGLAVGRVFGLR